jgi:hypothetical protein
LAATAAAAASSHRCRTLLQTHFLGITWLACLLAIAQPPAAGADRFSALLARGTRISGPEVVPWHFTGAQPKLGEAFLLDPTNHVRWLRDTTLPQPVIPNEFVEMVGGDRLPGRVLAFRDGAQSPFEALPPHLIVQPTIPYDWPDQPRDHLRVSTAWLKRIVWERHGQRPDQPGTAFLRDGRELKYRALRFRDDGIRLLLDDGPSEIAFAQLAELHLPATNPWEAYFQQLVHLSPSISSWLFRIDTTDGLRATCSFERFQAQAHGSHDPQRWYHMIQPAWSLDPLWIRHRSVPFRSFHPPGAVPLTMLEPHSDPTQSIPALWPVAVNNNVQGSPLRSGGMPQGWGLGVHATSRLCVELPSAGRSFRTRFGLDELAGRGGCVRAEVLLQPGDRSLFKSPVLVGSQQVLDTGPLPLPVSPGKMQSLVLIADAAHADRPPGADPFNIRDIFNWLDSEIELDPRAVQNEVLHRAPRAISAWQGWALETAEPEAVDLKNRWDDSLAGCGGYRLEVVSRSPFLTLSRQVEAPSPAWLCIAVSRFMDTSPCKLQIREGDRVLATLEVPQRHANSGDPDPLLVPLPGELGRPLRLQLLPLPAGPAARLDWRAIAIVDHPPGRLRLFADEAEFPGRLAEGSGRAELVEGDRFAGTAALQVAGGERAAMALPGLPVRIREQPRLGEFRYLRFAWKKQGGGRIALQLGHDGRFGPIQVERTSDRDSFRYDAGDGQRVYGAAIRLADRAPGEWVEVTRDLYADFGACELTGLGFVCPDGQHALFDQIYIGRTTRDLEALPK